MAAIEQHHRLLNATAGYRFQGPHAGQPQGPGYPQGIHFGGRRHPHRQGARPRGDFGEKLGAPRRGEEFRIRQPGGEVPFPSQAGADRHRSGQGSATDLVHPD